MNFKQIIRDYFTFSRNERKGVVILLIVIFVLAIANKMIFYLEKPAKIDKAEFDSAIKELAAYNDSINQESEKEKRTVDKGKSKNELTSIESLGNTLVSKNGDNEMFYFNPNKATDDEFKRLGFSEKQIDVIRKYMGKATQLKTKEDFFKIRVITDKQKEKLYPWVVFDDVSVPGNTKQEDNKLVVEEIEINTTDSIRLEKLPGIGKVLSKRIVKYRDLLGGFYSISQLNEVYGFEESAMSLVKSRLRVDSTKIRKIDLNFADSNELARHPYLKRSLANKIVAFRSKYGSISDPKVLLDNMILNIDEYKKLRPYFLNK